MGELDSVRVAAVAIAGIPGSGKTTLARALQAHYGWEYISAGDIARAVDPESLAVGGMADESRFQAAFRRRWASRAGPVVIDGIPRSRGQMALLPSGTRIIALTCRPDIARDRLLRRGRPDDVPDLVERRIREQSALLEVDRADGWLFRVGTAVNTSYKTAAAVMRDIVAYLDGRKPDPF